jgi:cytochrome d ubiquinol oxidase subunit II
VIATAVGAILLAAITLYAVLGGADFGGGLWDLLAGGDRAGGLNRQGGRVPAAGPRPSAWSP